jgi:hypothetical protein
MQQGQSDDPAALSAGALEQDSSSSVGAPPTSPSLVLERITAGIYCFVVVVMVIPGFMHILLPDGGAESIAGLDLDGCSKKLIKMLFAALGTVQVFVGCLLAFSLWAARIVDDRAIAGTGNSGPRGWRALAKLSGLVWLMMLLSVIVNASTLAEVAPKAPGRVKPYFLFALSTIALGCQLAVCHQDAKKKSQCVGAQ